MFHWIIGDFWPVTPGTGFARCIQIFNNAIERWTCSQLYKFDLNASVNYSVKCFLKVNKTSVQFITFVFALFMY